MRLKPFFSYFGGKWRSAKHYPKPACDTIIEPFAGSAGYAMLFHDRKVILCDSNPVVAGMWDFLIRSAPADILALPIEVTSTADLPVCQEAKALIGFWMKRGATRPNVNSSAWMRTGKYTGWFWGESVRARIAHQVEHIKHWKIHCKNYWELDPTPGTWFIDPPYKGPMGAHYPHHKLNYDALSGWCKTRPGQTIVCEGPDADWLPFKPLGMFRAASGFKQESIYCRSEWAL